jgi:hypothetical protein
MAEVVAPTSALKAAIFFDPTKGEILARCPILSNAAGARMVKHKAFHNRVRDME